MRSRPARPAVSTPHDASRRAGQDRVLALEPPRVGEPAVRLHEHEAHPLAELRRDPVDVAAKEGREVGVDHGGVAAPDELHEGARLVARRDLLEPDRAREAREGELVLRVAVAVHEHDGDGADPVPVDRPERRLCRLRPLRVEGRDHLAAGPDPRIDLDHPLVEHLGERDAKVEEAGARLVADPERIPEPPVDDEEGAVSVALEERVGRDGRAHLDRVDPPHRLIGGEAEDLPDPLEGGVPIVLGVVGEELVGDEAAVGAAGDHVRERAAPVDPELPAAARGRSAAHRAPPARMGRRGPAACGAREARASGPLPLPFPFPGTPPTPTSTSTSTSASTLTFAPIPIPATRPGTLGNGAGRFPGGGADT